ncbi:MAG: aminoglycoside phosphotransferase family protein [Candidatus Dormibacteraeota bacterium]|nr:aminoglycoside phosphotransferase family protein [Candidatus Dormibacteraeota bacterium]
MGMFGAGVEMADDLPQGEWSRAYAFRQGGRELVVRFNTDRHAFDVDLLALRFASPALPIPAVLRVGEVEGGYYAISERAFGDFLEDLPPERMEALVPSLLATLDALRTADTSTSTGFGPWDQNGDGDCRDWAEFLLDVDAGTPDAHRATWRDDLLRSDVAARAFREGMRALETLAPRCPNQRSLIHSDLLNRNAFVSGARVSALIDWQCAMYGDHLFELAWFTFWAPWHPGVAAAGLRDRAFAHWRAGGVDLTDFDLRVRCYEIRIGVAHLVYNAWRGDLLNLEATARRTLELLPFR